MFLAALHASIALHELGHLYFAKKFGCRVSQYMVGFGPTVCSWKRGETEYAIRLIPLGGYVRIIGMLPPLTDREKCVARGETLSEREDAPGITPGGLDDDLGESGSDSESRVHTLRRPRLGLFAHMISLTRSAEFDLIKPGDSDRLFYKLPARKKILVMLAGPAVNIVVAFLCCLWVYGIYGVHSAEPTGTTVISRVFECATPGLVRGAACEPGATPSPAKAMGLRPGDEIVSVNGQVVSSWAQLSDRLQDNHDGDLRLQVRRGGRLVPLRQVDAAVLDRDHTISGRDQLAGCLGAEPEQREMVTRLGPISTVLRMGEFTADTVAGVAHLPSRVWNVAQAIVGHAERGQDSPLSIVGASRLAAEILSSDVPDLDAGTKVAFLVMVVGVVNLAVGVLNLIPLMPLDGGHITAAAWEGIRRRLARLRRRPDPGYVNVTAQLPAAYCVVLVLVVMSVVLIIGDLVVPVRSGL
ncbi:M50 family metallopeptidase [Amycolatopsis sp. CA-230715]|uniref:M50 family metallopeptidase n=1 Tax=Amycolatopsis sp. CA-230715 TaxID=2745196 RepID=UPI001C01442A|nr:site-2 protease family protein [Amycolatopsis sp. CA-230715]